jgi:hypothetical protein
VATDSLTILNGTTLGPGSMVKATSGESSKAFLRNIVIRNGTGGTPVPGQPEVEGGAGVAIIGSDLGLFNVVIENCSADVGGGLLLVDSESTVSGIAVRNCTAAIAGGGAFVRDSETVILDLAFEGNRVQGAGFGGAILFENGLNALVSGTIVGNQVLGAGNGGGIAHLPPTDPALLGAVSVLNLDTVTVTGNSAAFVGGLWIETGDGSLVNLDGSTLCDNANGNINASDWVDLGGNQVCQCVGDLDGNGVVNSADLTAILGAWGPCPGPCPADINGDGVVDPVDLTAVLSGFGECP